MNRKGKINPDWWDIALEVTGFVLRMLRRIRK